MILLEGRKREKEEREREIMEHNSGRKYGKMPGYLLLVVRGPPPVTAG